MSNAKTTETYTADGAMLLDWVLLDTRNSHVRHGASALRDFALHEGTLFRTYPSSDTRLICSTRSGRHLRKRGWAKASLFSPASHANGEELAVLSDRRL